MKNLEQIKQDPRFPAAMTKISGILQAVGTPLKRVANSSMGRHLGFGLLGGGVSAGLDAASGQNVQGTDVLKGATAGLVGSMLHKAPAFKSIPGTSKYWAAGLYGANKGFIEPFNNNLKKTIIDRGNAAIAPSPSPDGPTSIGTKINSGLEATGNWWNSLPQNARMGLGIGGTSLAALLMASMMMRNRNKNEQDLD